MKSFLGAMRFAAPAIFVAGMVSGAAAQGGMSDAQVESNVLKALAGAPALAEEAITTRTVYGTVTLSGSVKDEATRAQAENLAANAKGVKKVVDELQLSAPAGSGQPAPVLQSDGTYAAATGSAAGTASTPVAGSAPAAMAQRNDPENDQALDQQMEEKNGQASGGQTVGQQQTAGESSSRAPGQPAYPQQSYPQYGQRTSGRRPLNGYPSPYGGPYGAPSSPAQGGYSSSYGQQPPYGGQLGGETVSVASGTMIRVRLNHSVSSDRSQAGSTFDGTVINDVVAGGAVAIPRGAAVQGKIVEAKGSGTFKGRGELSIELTSVTLGGKTYPLVSDVWAHHGGDKTIETIDKTAGFGAVGAALGAVGGGGVGAAVGGGIGAAVGLGSSAASGRGQVYVPAEGVLTFHLAQAASITTLSEGEMQRLAYGAGSNAGEDQRYLRRPSRVYVGPAIYPYGYPYPSPYYYGPYGYPRY